MPLFTPLQYDLYERLVARLFAVRSLGELRQVLLTEVRRLVPAESAVFLEFGPDGSEPLSGVVWELDPALFPLYAAHYHRFDLYKRTVHALPSPPAVTRASDYLEYASWGRNEHRADFLRPQRMHHIACLEIAPEGVITAFLSLHRSARRTDFSDRDLEVLRVLAPAVRAAYGALAGQPPAPAWAPFVDKLTVRERQLLPLLLTELPNETIARRLCVSINTLKTHVRHVLAKAGCASRFELLVRYGHPAPFPGTHK